MDSLPSPKTVNRRRCLTQIGLGGIALPALLSNETGAARPAAPHFEPRVKRVIFLFMVGGASHLETFNFRPALRKHAGKLAKDLFSAKDLAGFNPEKDFSSSRVLPSVFPFAQHGESGMWMSDIYPHLSQVADELTLVNSMKAASPIHSVGQILMHTGFNRPGNPSIGSWVTYGLGSENENMPGYVVMQDGISSGGTAMYHSGFLPGDHQATSTNLKQNQAPIDHLRRPAALTDDQQRRQLDLTQSLNELHLERNASQPELAARIKSFETAFKMQTAAPELFDLSKESIKTRRLYGETEFGRKCLTARRLIERGVRFVEVLDGATGRRWDAHGNRGGLIDNHRSNARRTDQPIAALIRDLKTRGLLDETLVVWATEFGRTPFEEARKERKIGRGHHHYAFSMWLAGGGLKSGLTYGKTDEFGMHVVKNVVTHHDLHATILHLLGLDHERLTYRHNGRDFRLTDVHGHVVQGILS